MSQVWYKEQSERKEKQQLSRNSCLLHATPFRGVPSFVALWKKILPFEVRKPRLTTCKVNILPAVSPLWAQFFHTFNAVHHHPFHFSSFTAKPRAKDLLFICLLLIYDDQGFEYLLHHSLNFTLSLLFLILKDCVLSPTWSLTIWISHNTVSGHTRESRFALSHQWPWIILLLPKERQTLYINFLDITPKAKSMKERADMLKAFML